MGRTEVSSETLWLSPSWIPCGPFFLGEAQLGLKWIPHGTGCKCSSILSLPLIYIRTHLCCKLRKIASSSLGLLTPEAACKPVTLLESYSAPFHLPHHWLCHVELYGWLLQVAKAAKSKLRNEVLNEVLLNLLNHRVNPRLKSVTLTLIPRRNGYVVK